MPRYRIIVAYDGTDYYGWQRQPHKKTVAGTLEETFKRVFNHKILLKAASRTDAGVHAHHQVAIFDLAVDINPKLLHDAWNNRLPSTILIRSLDYCDATFSPRHAVTTKVYHYILFRDRPLPHYARYGWRPIHIFDIEKLNRCLQIFVGTHNFSSFATLEDKKNPVRTIEAIRIEHDQEMNAYRIIFQGPSFLRYMIRRIVGACVDTASRIDANCDTLVAILNNPDPRQRLFCAPAQGLTLHSITYKETKDIS